MPRSLEQESPPRESNIQVHLERERKYLVYFPIEEYETYESEEIKQGYMPDEERIRRAVNGEVKTYTRSRKEGKGRDRIETEIVISKKEYKQLLSETGNRQVVKTRYHIPYPYNGKVYDIHFDVYKGPLEGRYVAEVEFENDEDADDFFPPYWFAEEVTGVSGFSNQDYAKEVEAMKSKRSK